MEIPKKKIIAVYGAPRAGKGIVVDQLQQKLGDENIDYLSLDNIRAHHWQALDRNEYPDLFQQHIDRDAWTVEEWIEKANQRFPDYFLERQLRQAKAIQNLGLRAVIDTALENRDTLVMEGVAATPEYLAELAEEYEVEAVFMGNQSDELANNMLEYAANREDDWLNTYTEEQVRAYADVSRRISRFAMQEAIKYEDLGFTYVEMSEGDFESNVKKVVELLGSKATSREVKVA